jgi:hypothetical protein
VPGTVIAEAIATDFDGYITVVRFFLNNKLMSLDTTSAYTAAFMNLTPGTYSIVAEAIDDKGAATRSPEVRITILSEDEPPPDSTPEPTPDPTPDPPPDPTPSPTNTPPVGYLISPASGAVYTRPVTLRLEAISTDWDGGVTRVQFFIGATQIGEVTTQPYILDWTPTAAGTYALAVKTTDTSGATSVSPPVIVTIK